MERVDLAKNAGALPLNVIQSERWVGPCTVGLRDKRERRLNSAKA